MASWFPRTFDPAPRTQLAAIEQRTNRLLNAQAPGERIANCALLMIAVWDTWASKVPFLPEYVPEVVEIEAKKLGGVFENKYAQLSAVEIVNGKLPIALRYHETQIALITPER